MANNFDSWYLEVISDQRWYELLRAYKDKTIEAAAKRVFAQLVADNTVDVRPMPENRKHVYNILSKNPGDKPAGTPWHVQAAINIANAVKDEWKAVSPEERAKRLKEWEAIVRGSTMLNSMPKPSYKTLAEEGGVLPPKPAPYPITTPEEAYIRDRHLAWIEDSFEPKTGMKLPGALDEETFNAIYDSEKLNKQDK